MVQARAPLIVAIVLMAMLLLPLIYVGSYCALSFPQPGNQRGQRFRIRGPMVWYAFLPLTYLDHQMRPDFWKTNSVDLVGDREHRRP